MSYLEPTLKKMDKTTKLPTVIGITGKKFNGKDTVADYLHDKLDYIKLSYATPLKEACRIMFGFNDEQLYGSLKETPDPRWKNITPRQVFQYFGTELVRNQMGKLIQDIGTNFWVICLVNKLNTILKENPNAKIVIPDVRFPDEIEILKKLEFPVLLLRVKRPSLNNSGDNHDSEKFIDDLEVDHEIINDSTKEELYKKVDNILDDYS